VSAPVLCTVGVVIMFYIESHWIHQNTWKPIVCCLFSGCGINVFRMASSNSSHAEKSCACAYIAFLAGIFSCYADSTLEAGHNRLHSRHLSSWFTFIMSFDNIKLYSWQSVVELWNRQTNSLLPMIAVSVSVSGAPLYDTTACFLRHADLPRNWECP
jgi:uncharacterized membrane protein YhaH (DUF805 family)